MIAPMALVSYILGSLAEYEQNVGLYGSFTTLSSVLGWVWIEYILKYTALFPDHCYQSHILQ